MLYLNRIVHGEMKLVIRIKHIDKTTSNLQKLPTSNGIYMWSYCEHCREVNFEGSFEENIQSFLYLVISQTFNVSSYMVIIIYKIS